MKKNEIQKNEADFQIEVTTKTGTGKLKFNGDEFKNLLGNAGSQVIEKFGNQLKMTSEVFEKITAKINEALAFPMDSDPRAWAFIGVIGTIYDEGLDEAKHEKFRDDLRDWLYDVDPDVPGL